MDSVLNSFNLAWQRVAPLFVNLISALFFLLIGFIVAKALEAGVIFVAKLINLDKLAKQAKFSEIFEKADIRKPVSSLLGGLVYWLVIFITVIGMAEIYTLPLEPAISNFFGYLAIVLVFAMILGIGLFFASLFSGIVRVIAVNIGIEGAKTLSRFIYYIVVIITFLVALGHLGVSTDFFVPQIGVIIGAFGLAAAIAFGLGCKDMAADFLHNLFKGK
ncbi:MAG: hypothetical protein WCV91_06775 [Candidatus Margulisiibacteriota bacterium]